MKTLKIFFTLSFIVVLFACTKQQNNDNFYVINLHIEGKKFDYMALHGYVLYRGDLKIIGQSRNGYDWKFEIPKFTVDSIFWLSLKTRQYNPNDTAVYYSRIIDIHNADTLFSFELPANDKNNIVYNLKYLKTKKHREKGHYFLNDTYLSEYNAITDIFEIQGLNEDLELASSLKYRFFGVFDEEKNYDNQIQNHINAVKDKPDSQYLMSRLFAQKYDFKSKTDIEKIYNCFSEKNKKSFFGKVLNEYLHPVFENIKLPLVNDENITEPLIQDFTKLNLIELTASWCGWCHKIVPVLKELNEQYKDKLIITYVTVDKEEKMDTFRKQLEEKQITWRSLWAKDSDTFVYRLGNSGIPCGVLVDTDGNIIDCLNLNAPEDLEKLHNALRNK